MFVEYETKIGLPCGTIRQAVIGQAYTAWEQLERGEISVDEFSRKFGDECSEIVSFWLCHNRNVLSSLGVFLSFVIHPKRHVLYM